MMSSAALGPVLQLRVAHRGDRAFIGFVFVFQTLEANWVAAFADPIPDVLRFALTKLRASQAVVVLTVKQTAGVVENHGALRRRVRLLLRLTFLRISPGRACGSSSPGDESIRRG